MNFLWGNTRVYEILARFSTLGLNFLCKNRIRFCTNQLTRQIFRKHKIRKSIFYYLFHFLPEYYPIYSFYTFILLLFIAALSIFSVWATLKWIFCTWNLKPLPPLISGLLFKTELTILIKRESISGQGWVLGQFLREPLILKTLLFFKHFAPGFSVYFHFLQELGLCQSQFHSRFLRTKKRASCALYMIYR